MSAAAQPQPVNVLASMVNAEDELTRCASIVGPNRAKAAEAACIALADGRLAVAELIEADREYDEARKAFDGARNTSASTECWNRLIVAQRKRAAALARIGAAS